MNIRINSVLFLQNMEPFHLYRVNDQHKNIACDWKNRNSGMSQCHFLLKLVLIIFFLNFFFKVWLSIGRIYTAYASLNSYNIYWKKTYKIIEVVGKLRRKWKINIPRYWWNKLAVCISEQIVFCNPTTTIIIIMAKIIQLKYIRNYGAISF